jgi:hypothetical protein
LWWLDLQSLESIKRTSVWFVEGNKSNKKEGKNYGFGLLQGWYAWPIMNTFGISLWKNFTNIYSKKKKRNLCGEVWEAFAFRVGVGVWCCFGVEVFQEVNAIAFR